MDYEYRLLLDNYMFNFTETLDKLDIDVDNILIELGFKKSINIDDEDFTKVLNILIDNVENLSDNQKGQLEVILEQYELYAHKLKNSIVTNNPIKKIIYDEAKLNDIYLTRQQYNLKESLWQGINGGVDTFILSAPTSFGKSSLINEIIIEISKKINSRILIILPTKALINEYYAKLKSKFKNIITNPFIANKETNGFIFIGTPERVLLLNKNDYDIVVIDDIYFSSEFVDREKSFIIALKKIENNKKVFIVPNIDGESMYKKLLEYDVYLGKWELKEYSYEDSPVSNSFMKLHVNVKGESSSTLEYKDKCITISNESDKDSFIAFANCLNSLNKDYNIYDGCLIYHCNKTHASKVLNTLNVELSDEAADDNELKILIKYIKENMHEDSELINFLQEGKSIHNADLDEFTREVIERLYVRGIIKVIYATSTLAKGVNLPCRNIFLITLNHNANITSELDIKNIMGRVGRFKTFNNGNRIIVKLNKTKSKNDVYFTEEKMKEKFSFKDGINKLDNDIKKVISEDANFSNNFKNKNNIDFDQRDLKVKNYVDYSLGYSKKEILKKYIQRELISIENRLPTIFLYDTLKTLFVEVNKELENRDINDKFIFGSEKFNAFIYSKIITNTSIRDLIYSNKGNNREIYITKNGKIKYKQRAGLNKIDYENKEHINALLYHYLNTFSSVQFKVRSFLLNFIELYKEIYTEKRGEALNFDEYIEKVENDTDNIDVIILKGLGLRHQFLINSVCTKSNELKIKIEFTSFEQVKEFINNYFDDGTPEKYAINTLY